MQYVVIVVLIAVIYFFFIKKRPIVKKNKQHSSQTQKKEKIQSNDMIECQTCGIYCEVDDSILSNGKHYCSKECVDKA